MGGALLQIVDRYTQRFAMKASSAKINGEWVDVVKDPITDSGKKSKAGRVTLWQSGREYFSCVDKPKTWTDYGAGDATEVLEEVYRDGRLVKEITFEQIRQNTAK
jgi:nicotinamide phosphoribosyltransferase